MAVRVVDASVVAKWIIPEEHSEEARLLRSRHERLIAPDILPLEMGRVLLKKHRRGELTVGELRQPLVAALSGTIRFHRMLGLLAVAMEIEIEYQRDPFDAVYVALALRERCTLVTADRVLYDAMSGPFPETMVWVGDLPSMFGSA